MPSSLWTSCFVATALLTPSISAYQTLAHRGLFHDVTDGSNIAENTVSALQRAADFGLPGVEFDVRPSKDGVLWVTHDMISNRATIQDNAKGLMNPIDVALKSQPAPKPIFINQHFADFWNLVPLKVYGRQGKIIKPDGAQKMEFLEAMLGHLKNLDKPNFMLILDIQDPGTFKTAAGLVKKTGTSKQVYLKFFAKKAIDSTNHKLNQKDHKATCLQYAKDNGFDGLQVIPQINDGELTIVNNKAYLDVFQYRFLVTEYLSCWFDAQRAFNTGAAIVPIVSASVPFQNNPAHQAGQDALLWASDARGTCQLYSWDSTNVAARLFNTDAQQDKEQFARAFIRSEDYIVIDVMGDVKTHTYSGDFTFFKNNLC
ncbi:uncharacterized protein CLAFUR5_09264 [Fulvia fulva]|uniref:GP-PDE domain-containing protein n=1 Tax=Passalora fulva TaxID=5499 RepID=A0A9Q8PFL6_PASFU|nr:uncharacterized protein CLAFUR5_09264 [Fulvia fulva]UJO21532.1 hypothetical protein CLAFUR5_09264 [Fulvia fulva]